ncbi:MAG: hypothetical protein IKP50_04445 [Bacilli bacterium]|nr:hypothetical protein [Bacilli bacterium]
MKINKKLLIPVFASAMGLSVIGGLSGAVAWYQYNTKVSASYMGVTTADGGVLQISTNGTDWDRDLYFGSATSKLHPVTFGDLGNELELPTKARKHPHAGVADPSQWDEATVNVDYYQFNMYVKALKLENGEYVQKAVNVYLEDFVLQAITEGKTDIGSALRVHLDIAGGSKYLISPTAITGQACPLFGNLDLDRSGADDKVGGYQWEENYNQDLVYGTEDAYQVTTGADSLISNSQALFSTSASDLVRITVTVWLEGWHKVAFGTNAASAIWDADKGNGSTIHFGLKLNTPKTSFLED